MKLDSKYFDSLRAKPGRGANEASEPEAAPRCQWKGCQAAGTYRAPMGRGYEGRYFRFCLAHVQAYNKSYNYFDGMSDSAVRSFVRDAVTGHRPTWKVGANGTGPGAEQDLRLERARQRFTRGARFSMLDDDEPRERKSTANPIIGNMARKSLRQLNLEDGANKAQIKQRFKELVKRHHPDVNGGDKRSEERLREIITAYNYLKQSGYC